MLVKLFTMKLLTALLIFIGSYSLFSQSEGMVGNYYVNLVNTEDNRIEYKMTLNEDGTFLFHSYSKIDAGIPQAVDTYGRGTWNLEKNVISFFSKNGKDVDEKHTLDFTHSKARLITKSVRNMSDKSIKTRMKFFKSEIFWIRGIEIVKG